MRSSRYGKYRFANRSRAENLDFFVYKFFTFAISTGAASIVVSRLLASACRIHRCDTVHAGLDRISADQSRRASCLHCPVSSIDHKINLMTKDQIHDIRGFL